MKNAGLCKFSDHANESDKTLTNYKNIFATEMSKKKKK